MTDKEIIKALEGMTYGGHSCMHCKYGTTKGDDRCGLQGCKIGRDALDLINRQQAEIERLTVNMNAYALGMKRLSEQLETAKAEAIKKVTTELYNCFVQYEKYDRLHIYEILDRINNIEEFLLDNLVKEMTEG